MKSIFFLLSLFSVIFSSTISARAIHLVALGDTNDPTLGSAVLVDLKNAEDVLSYLSKQCGVPIYIKQLAGDNLTFKNFQTWLQESVVSSDDIIILYFSGHGARTSSSPTMWPFGWLAEGERVEFTKMIEGILAKKAALSIAVLESCNKEIELPRIQNRGLNDIPALEDLNAQRIGEGCKKLFFDPYGLIISSGASPGGYSIGVTYRGSYFTSSFLANLIEEAQAKNPSWKRIFKMTKSECYRLPTKETKKKWGYQVTQHKLFLFPQRKSPRAYKWYLYNRCFGQNVRKSSRSAIERVKHGFSLAI
jgi:hypothetical protein